jgi:hypothetical protein
LTVVDERGFGDDGKTQERKKGFVTVADIDATVRLSAAINARCVRPCVYVCVLRRAAAKLSWLWCALRPSFAPPFFSSFLHLQSSSDLLLS